MNTTTDLHDLQDRFRDLLIKHGFTGRTVEADAEIKVAEQAIRDAFPGTPLDGSTHYARGEEIIAQIETDVERDWQIIEGRKHLLAALTAVDKAVADARGALHGLTVYYDVEVTEGDAGRMLPKALDEITLAAAAAKHYAPPVDL
jgi:hypothetical protein